MIYYVVLYRHRRAVYPLLYYWARDLRRQITILTYESFAERTSLEPGTYIFTDLECLTNDERHEYARRWSQMGSAPGFRALNHPTRSMGRHQLLTALHDCGFNRFRAYRLSETAVPERFPVFVRREDEHKLLFPLIHSQAELDQIRVQLGEDVERTLMIEFCDTSDEDGLFRKYSSYRVGTHIIPIHIMFSKNWYVKNSTTSGEQAQREEWEYLKQNPHEQEIDQTFRTARIEYGRIDYSLLGDRVQVWEINTNPGLLPLIGRNRYTGLKPRFLQHLRESLNPRHGLKLHFLRQYRAALAEL